MFWPGVCWPFHGLNGYLECLDVRLAVKGGGIPYYVEGFRQGRGAGRVGSPTMGRGAGRGGSPGNWRHPVALA